MGKKHAKKRPFVSVICVTFNRRPFFPAFFECLRHQDYPKSRFEIIIVDDGTDKVRDLVEASGVPNIKYVELPTKLPLGKKRNFSHTLIAPHSQYITYFDDDDYHHPSRISHSVEMLEAEPGAMCAGASELYVYFKHIQQMYQFGPYGPNHATAGTFMFRRALIDGARYQDDACLAEEKAFLKDYTVPMVQLNPLKNILCFSHEHNTFDKRKLLDNPHPQFCKPSIKTVKHFISQDNEEGIRTFFLTQVDAALAAYEPGDPKNKPDVLQQMKQIDAERAAQAQAHQQAQAQAQQQAQPQQLILQRPGMPPVALSPSDCLNIIRQQAEQIANMQKRIDELEKRGAGAVFSIPTIG